jgi:hypothetical protein
MRNILSKLFQFILIGATLAATCGKNGSQKSKSELLTHAPWKYEKAGFDSNQDGYIDVLDPKISGCQRDDIILFNRDGTGSFNIGGTKCELSDPSSLPFIWSFEDKGNAIYFQEQHFRIMTLSSSRLEMFAYQQSGTTRTKYMIILKH